jgi:DNA-binding CsgD family transcriptional regulator
MAGPGISKRDLQIMMRVVNDDTAGEGPGQGLPWSLLAAFKELIPCDELSFRDLDAKDGRATFSQAIPACSDGEADDRAFWANYWDCLACCYPDRTGDLRSITTISDFYTQRQLHSLGMHADMLGPAGIEHEMMLCLPGGPDRTLRLLFFRGPGSDFTERDRALLALLRPHLHVAYLRAEQRRGLSALTRRQQEVLHLVAAGYGNAQIARRLVVSDATVRKHLENIYQRLDVTSRTTAIARVFPGLGFLAHPERRAKSKAERR